MEGPHAGAASTAGSLSCSQSIVGCGELSITDGWPTLPPKPWSDWLEIDPDPETIGSDATAST